MNQSFIFGGNTGMSYDQIQKQRDIANELLRANMYTPQNVGEGLSAIGRALAAKAIDKRTARADETNRAASAERRASAFGSIFGGAPSGGSAPYAPATPATPAQSVADDTMSALGKTPMRPFRDAIASIESAGSGDYSAVGPTNPRLGRALGRYQIMEANIGPWSREVLGREVTPEEFMANPQLQDAIFDGKFGQYVQQFGPEGAAQAWFAGPGGVGKMDRQDVLGTSVADYTQKFSAALGGAPAEAPAPSMGNPATIQMIAELLADPYTPPGEKAMLEQAMAMQLQSMDPMRQMEMERARLELEQMRQPQPQARTRIVSGEEAAALGLDPAKSYNLTEGPSGVEASAIGGGGTTIVNDMVGEPGQYLYGTDAGLPAGWRLDTRTGEASVIPNGPADVEAGATEDANEKAAGGRDIATQTITSAASRAREAAENRIVGGALAGIAAMNPSSENAEVYRQVDVLKSQAIVGNLQAMRDASPTGGALGAVTAPELKMLADKSGALDPRSPNFVRDLNDYELSLLQVIHGPEEGQRIFEATRSDAPTGPDKDGWQTINGVKIRVKQ